MVLCDIDVETSSTEATKIHDLKPQVTVRVRKSDHNLETELLNVLQKS